MDLSDLDPRQARIDLDREFIRRKGLAEFIRRAWRQVEPATPLVWNWHIDAMSELLESCSDGDTKNALICIPPGLSKSLVVSTFWPSWDWIKHPGRRFIAATYANELSNKNAKLHRDLVASDWYAERWGEIVTITRATTNQVKNFENTAGGGRVSTAVGSGITGRHANVLIFDDLVKAQDAEGKSALEPKKIEAANEFWFKTMATRQADPATTVKVGIMQRLHYDDTAARCIDSGDYELLVLPMRYDPDHPQVWARDPRKEKGALLCPSRFPEETVQTLEKSLGPTTAAAQLGQTPAPAGGAVIKRSDLIHTHDGSTAVSRMIITVDCAFKDTAGSDRVAIQTWAKVMRGVGWRYHLMGAVADRMDIRGTLQAVRNMAARWPMATSIHVENRANGSAVVNMLEGEISGIQEWPPKGDGFPSKIERVNAVLPLFENGEVLLPEGEPWVEDYIQELIRFPVGKHDDQVDATSMALLILRTSMADAYAKAWGKKK